MSLNTEELRRPVEWLLKFDEDAHRYEALVRDSGGVPLAAWRLARARCRIQSVPSLVPTTRELWAAARRIVLRVPDVDVPSLARLVAECELLGLEVIVPMSARHAA